MIIILSNDSHFVFESLVRCKWILEFDQFANIESALQGGESLVGLLALLFEPEVHLATLVVDPLHFESVVQLNWLQLLFEVLLSILRSQIADQNA